MHGQNQGILELQEHTNYIQKQETEKTAAFYVKKNVVILNIFLAFACLFLQRYCPF